MGAMFCFVVTGPELMPSFLDVKLKKDFRNLSSTINTGNLEMAHKEGRSQD